MQRFLCIATLAAFLPVSSIAQTPEPPSAPSQTNGGPERVEVYYGGPGVTLPRLQALPQTSTTTGKCHSKQEARVRLSLIVDSKGQPHNATFDRPVGNEFDELALMVLEHDRFEPGTYQAAPVAIGLAVEMHLEGCVEQTKDAAGKKTTTLKLRSQPEQSFEEMPQPQQEIALVPLANAHSDTPHLARVGHGVTPPKAILQREAEFSDYARQKKIQGSCVVSLVVDVNGMPQNVHIARSLEPSLDQNAVLSVRKYRFQPAMMNGIPVPVAISVEVTFRLY